MIIWRDRPLASDFPEDPASCIWSSGGTGLSQMIIRHPHHPIHLSQDLDSISRTFLEQFALVCFQVRCMSPACFSSSSDQSSFEKRLISSNKDYHFHFLVKNAITFQTFEKDNTSSATATSRALASEAVPSGCKTWINWNQLCYSSEQNVANDSLTWL